MQKVNSFDIFDTLIGRYCGNPDGVFDIVEKRTGFKNYKLYRKQAESQSNKTWNGIFDKLQQISKCSREVRDKLMNIEFEVEYEMSFPIVCMLNKVKDGDVLVSDMYMTESQIRALLAKHHFDRSVQIFVSSNGKHDGWIWQKIKSNGILIGKHIGDNHHSDYLSPKKFGIDAEHFTLSHYTSSENALITSNMSPLANCSRYIRLQNPNTDEELTCLWNEQAQFNIPLLISVAHSVAKEFKVKKIDKVLFCTRDAVLLKKVFDKMYPKIPSHTFYTSRALYEKPTPDYIAYCNELITSNSLLVDFHGTGKSFMNFMIPQKLSPWLMFVSSNGFFPSFADYQKKIILSTKVSDTVERLNIDLVGTYYDFYNGKPISWKYEFDPKYAIVFHECVDTFVKNLHFLNVGTQLFDIIFGNWVVNHYKPQCIWKVLGWNSLHFPPNVNLQQLRTVYRQNPGLLNMVSKSVNQEYFDIADQVPVKKQLQYFSQIGQDKFYIEEYSKYKREGFFLDIGAYDGKTFSNTYTLEKYLGWTGICVEANPKIMDPLQQYRKCIISNSVLWSDESWITLEFPREKKLEEGNDLLVSVKLPGEHDDSVQFNKTKKIVMKSITLTKLLDQLKAPKYIDLMTIDTGGSEYVILSELDWNKYKIGFIMVEHGNREDYRKKLRDLLESKGYRFYKTNQFDDYYELINKSQ